MSVKRYFDAADAALGAFLVADALLLLGYTKTLAAVHMGIACAAALAAVLYLAARHRRR